MAFGTAYFLWIFSYHPISQQENYFQATLVFEQVASEFIQSIPFMFQALR